MKPKRGKSSYVLLAGILGLLIVSSWLIYQVYAALTKTQITKEQAVAILPLDGSVQQEVLEDLRGRRVFSQVELTAVVLNSTEASAAAQRL